MSQSMYQPSHQQTLLLKAALHTGQGAIQAWEDWINAVDINEIDFASQCMLPLLMKNLLALGVSDPAVKKFKGVYRRTWYNNQILFTEMESVLRSFNREGIEVLALKGAALINKYYPDLGVRYMSDFDLLVPPRKFFSAIEMIRQLGWQQKLSIGNLTEKNISYHKEAQFFSQSGRIIDLHSHFLFHNSDPDADKDFWEAAIPIYIRNEPAFALNPTDQLFHVCVHGMEWDHRPSVRWIADAYILLQTEQTIDWDRLIDQSQKWHVTLTIKQALHYLKNELDAAIPDEVISRLKAIEITNDDRLHDKLYNLPPKFFSGFKKRIYVHNHFFAQNANFFQRLGGFPRFLQHSWKVKHLATVPITAAVKSVRRVRKYILGQNIK